MDSDEKIAHLSQKGKSKLWLLPLILALLISSGLLYWYLFLYGSVSTDNAYVMADSATISSRIPGTVLVIYAENDKYVEKGALLLELDPSDYELQKAQAEATLERLRAEIRAMEIEIELTERTSKSNYKAAKAAMEGSKEQKKRLQE
ncbi:MAG: biotin/lipoyl-binding protein, partial [Desulfatiglandales bacterium]